MRISTPMLSIIVPMHNSEDTIEICIESILNQDFEEYELILVDDGSTDDTLKKCALYVEKDKRVKVISLSKNSGATAARKAGIERAMADIVGFVDSDDWIERDMYSNLMKIFQENDCDLLSSGIFRDYMDKNYTVEVVDNFSEGMYYNLPESVYSTMLYDDNERDFGIFCTLVNKLFKKDILSSVYDDINPQVFYGEDCLTLFSYIMKISTMYIMRKSYYHYNIRENSVCGMADVRLATNAYYLYKELERIFADQEEYKYVLLRQLRKYILRIELHTLDKLYNINAFSLGTYKYNYDYLKKKKIVLYGAGNSSESLYKYLTRECNCDIIAWVDQDPSGKDRRVLHEILPAKSILNLDYEYIVIAVLNERLAKDIKQQLIDYYNVDENKIVWNKVEYSDLIDKV